MTKSLLLALALVACGSSKPKTAPPPAEPTPAAAEPAKPAEPAEPAKPAEPAEPAAPAGGDAAALGAQAALTDQYETGKKLYVDKKCNTCHGDKGEGNAKNPKLIGDGALPEKAPAKAKLRKGVKFDTAKDVLGFVKAKMPLKNNPGSLSDADAAAVTAWILNENKVAMTAPLDASNADSVKLR